MFLTRTPLNLHRFIVLPEKKDTAPSCAGFPAKGRAVLVCGVLQRTRSSQKATALAAATFSESTPWDMGMHTV